MCNLEAGWIYPVKALKEIEIYPQQFLRLQDFKRKLDPKEWKRVSFPD